MQAEYISAKNKVLIRRTWLEANQDSREGGELKQVLKMVMEGN